MYINPKAKLQQKDALQISIDGVRKQMYASWNDMNMTKRNNCVHNDWIDRARKQASHAIKYLKLKKIAFELHFILISMEYE